ncbi:MAG: xanthine dehydrogenase family protein subunit M [Bryobacteraceae bacterium]|nr:xanthine dehydrogenase family protein subunit M [Bryobacteraceae bacterium]
MIPDTFDYSAPVTLTEAIELLSSGAKALAGGQSLIPLMKLRLASPQHLVDLSRIPELSGIREENGVVHIGAMTTHYEIESSMLLRTACPLLPQTASRIGDVQIRNMGTIGGSIAHADPASDYPAALLALDAVVRIAGAGGFRTISYEDLLVDSFSVALEPGEVIVDIMVPVDPSNTGTCYVKAPQAASGFAIVGVAVRAVKTDGIVSSARVGVTGLAAKPFRARSVERQLEGTRGTDADIIGAAALVGDGVDANSDLHASADYRKHLAEVYLRRALRAALI